MLHKEKTEMEPSATQHQEEGKRDDGHVPKVKRGLEDTTHPTPMEVIIERICVNK